MFFEVLSLTYHSPITIESLTYRVSLGYRSLLVCRYPPQIQSVVLSSTLERAGAYVCARTFIESHPSEGCGAGVGGVCPQVSDDRQCDAARSGHHRWRRSGAVVGGRRHGPRAVTAVVLDQDAAIGGTWARRCDRLH